MNDRPALLSEWVWHGFEYKVRRTYSGRIAGTVDAKMRPHRWEAEGDGFVRIGSADTIEAAQVACDAALSRMKCYELPGAKNDKPTINPEWDLSDGGQWFLWYVDRDTHAYAARIDGGCTYVWGHVCVDGRILTIEGDDRPLADRKAACEQALRDAGYQFAEPPATIELRADCEPLRRSMTTGLPLVDDADRLAPASYLPAAVAALHTVLRLGAERYPDEKWRTQNVAEHLRHAREHIRLHTIGDDSEPHLRHALTRLAFAVELNEGGGK